MKYFINQNYSTNCTNGEIWIVVSEDGLDSKMPCVPSGHLRAVGSHDFSLAPFSALSRDRRSKETGTDHSLHAMLLSVFVDIFFIFPLKMPIKTSNLNLMSQNCIIYQKTQYN